VTNRVRENSRGGDTQARASERKGSEDMMVYGFQMVVLVRGTRQYAEPGDEEVDSKESFKSKDSERQRKKEVKR